MCVCVCACVLCVCVVCVCVCVCVLCACVVCVCAHIHLVPVKPKGAVISMHLHTMRNLTILWEVKFSIKPMTSKLGNSPSQLKVFDILLYKTMYNKINIIIVISIIIYKDIFHEHIVVAMPSICMKFCIRMLFHMCTYEQHLLILD